MRTPLLLLAGLALALAGENSTPARAADNVAALPEARFRETVRPFLDTYCLSCHGKEKPKGDIDLSAFSSAQAVAKDLARWELVLEQLEAKTMPPAKAKRHPSPQAREEIMAWVRSVRALEATRNAGDPGPVPARRLSNAEYDYSIRDLTGVDIRPTREFPVDPANEAGFDNTGESLTMSPALLKKYLEAARKVADHLVLTPDGFAFAPYPVVADTDRDKYCVRRIIEFYRRQPTDYAAYFQAAWRYQHRRALGKPSASLADLAAEARISPGYLARVWSILNDPAGSVGPIAAVQVLWRALPGAAVGNPDVAKAGCEQMRDFVVELRESLRPEVPNLRAPGVGVGSQTMILWKNRQLVANRRRYAGNASTIKAETLTRGTPEARALALPADPKPVESDFERFCSTFPDAFLISERARAYLDPKQEKDNTGRYLSAGFHNMMGYFRDDAPLAELILDDRGRRELETLWEEFDFITGSPIRQYSGFLWYERAESSFMRADEFDFARAEDKNAGSEAMIRRLAEVYLAKARRLGASDRAIAAIEDHFRIISAQIRRVEEGRRAAEPRQIEAIQNFAARAYRRPLTSAERDGLAVFYRTLRDDGLGHEEAVRDSIVGILMSPHFCYRVDLPSAGKGVQPLSDLALASRLSYFLWSSLPDEELLAHARAGDLHREDVLKAQARRMLKDDRIRALAVEFGGNWLDFRRFEEHNSVDRQRFATFDDELRRAMFEEPVRFFVDLVRNDRPVTDFLEAKHTFVNQALARHYGMPLPGGEDWVRVDDADRHGRGGLLPMAVFLTKNAPGLRTSPVKRGYWVVRRLLGEKIPAPPANVPELPSDESKLGEQTLRQALARHRADASCAGCHERFDSIGLAFEGYGPVGELRTIDLGGRPVETRATFPGGVEGQGVEGLRSYLQASRREEFVANLAGKLLAYALGRSLIPSDDQTLETLRSNLSADGGRFRSLVETIVVSPQFRNKRFDPAPEAE